MRLIYFGIVSFVETSSIADFRDNKDHRKAECCSRVNCEYPSYLPLSKKCPDGETVFSPSICTFGADAMFCNF